MNYVIACEDTLIGIVTTGHDQTPFQISIILKMIENIMPHHRGGDWTVKLTEDEIDNMVDLECKTTFEVITPEGNELSITLHPMREGYSQWVLINKGDYFEHGLLRYT